MARKSKKQKRTPVTLLSIESATARSSSGQWSLRSDIAANLGRPKSTYLISMIEAAVEAGMIVKADGQDPHGRPAYVYQSAIPF